MQLSERYNDVAQTMSKETQYLLPKFAKGTVFFKGGEQAAATLNYNLLLGQMQFIGEDSSIMEIANVSEVRYVTIGKRFFIRSKDDFIEVVIDGSVQLGIVRKLRIVNHRKDGGYGGTTSLMKVESVSTLEGAPADHLTGTEELVFEENKTFYLIQDFKPKVASKKAFIKAFPRCKDEIAKQNIDYAN
ncbi:MAG: hypothetical protein LBS63_02305, partial [Prevotellaceae bacterium]|nr:hypothetical protein [Prevotellaceae bacterium]